VLQLYMGFAIVLKISQLHINYTWNWMMSPNQELT
jgi:hypothetical protein